MRRTRKAASLLLSVGLLAAFCLLLFSACDTTGPADDDDDGDGDAEGIALELVAEGFTHPVMLAEAPDGTERLFVADQTGAIWVVMPDGTLREEPFLDISDRVVELNPGYDERGLLGLAFHPDYATNGRFFVYYSAPLRAGAPAEFNHTSHLAEFEVSADDPNRADAASERILLQVDQPQGNHNAGTLAFGPGDDYLYVSLGDGGGANDVDVGHVEDWYAENSGGNAQNITENLLGSILRIDVDGGDPYGIPPENPFVDEEGLDEIYAYGLRNPYRFSFDRASGDLLAGDAGQNLYEEVSRVESGGNYGWNVKEGVHCFDAENPNDPPAECPDAVGAEHPREGDPLIDPVIEFPNANLPDGLGQVVVGGYTYRGDALPELLGQYLFGVATRGQGQGGAVFAAQPESGDGLWEFSSAGFVEDTGEGVVSANGELSDVLLSFGQDLDGELYLLTATQLGPTGSTGKVFRFAPGEGAP